MILDFGDTETEKIWLGNVSKKFPFDIQNVARRKLRMLNNAQIINDLRIPPANRLEKLKGNLEQFYSIRINNKFRLIFLWEAGNCSNVEIIDYH